MIKIQVPTLIIDEKKVRDNIENMATKAKKRGLNFRPHFKTHHSRDVGSWYRDYGVESIAVSSVDMATYFAGHGWKDITIAFPYNPHEASKISAIPEGIKINILVESFDAIEHASKFITRRFNYFVKVDVGTKRTGIDSSEIETIRNLLKWKPEFSSGILVHAGHTYSSRSVDDILNTFNEVSSTLGQLKNALGNDTFISFGDTPSCSVAEEFTNIDEIRCGNFAYYDLMQEQIGSCHFENIAVSVACPVVATHYDRSELLIYGGAVHFSKDAIEMATGMSYGQVVEFQDSGWKKLEGLYLRKISQEHGIIKGPNNVISTIKFGDVLGIVPVHACLAADLTSNQMTLDGLKVSKIQR